MTRATRKSQWFTNFEQLEDRRLMSVVSEISAQGVLTITGTSGNDAILVSPQSNYVDITDGSVTVRRNGVVNRVLVRAGGGNDKVVVHPYATRVARFDIRGEAGNDSLTGGSGNDTLSGGMGTASLFASPSKTLSSAACAPPVLISSKETS